MCLCVVWGRVLVFCVLHVVYCLLRAVCFVLRAVWLCDVICALYGDALVCCVVWEGIEA